MDSNLIFGLAVFLGREAWNSLWGARAKTLAALDAAEKKINSVQLDLTKALAEIQFLRESLSRLEASDRKYRK